MDECKQRIRVVELSDFVAKAMLFIGNWTNLMQDHSTEELLIVYRWSYVACMYAYHTLSLGGRQFDSSHARLGWVCNFHYEYLSHLSPGFHSLEAASRQKSMKLHRKAKCIGRTKKIKGNPNHVDDDDAADHVSYSPSLGKPLFASRLFFISCRIWFAFYPSIFYTGTKYMSSNCIDVVHVFAWAFFKKMNVLKDKQIFISIEWVW